MEFELIPYKKENGTIPVYEFLMSQPEKMRSKILKELDILEEYGNLTRGIYSKHLEDGIFEVRVKFASDITRVLYFFYDQGCIVLTNGFVKKQQKTPKQEIDRAKRYRNDFINRRAQDDIRRTEK